VWFVRIQHLAEKLFENLESEGAKKNKNNNNKKNPEDSLTNITLNVIFTVRNVQKILMENYLY